MNSLGPTFNRRPSPLNHKKWRLAQTTQTIEHAASNEKKTETKVKMKNVQQLKREPTVYWMFNEGWKLKEEHAWMSQIKPSHKIRKEKKTHEQLNCLRKANKMGNILSQIDCSGKKIIEYIWIWIYNLLSVNRKWFWWIVVNSFDRRCASALECAAQPWHWWMKGATTAQNTTDNTKKCFR